MNTLEEIQSDYEVKLQLILSEDLIKSESEQNKKLLYLAKCIFDFITYDEQFDVILSVMMLETLTALHIDKTSLYVSMDEENYRKYILMVNTPFLKDKIGWGTSIRHAFIKEEFKKEIESILKFARVIPS